MSWQSCIRAIAILSLLAFPVMAATFVVPDDETFIRKADVIVTGTVLSSHVQYEERGGIETVYRIAVDEVLKGQADPILEIREWGGVIGSRFMVASGAPRYQIGQRYLIFMTPFRDGRLTTLDFALGQFRFVEEHGQQVLERDRDEIVDLSERGLPFTRPATRFVEKIRDQVSRDGEMSAESRVVVSPQVNNLDTAGAASIGASAWSNGTSVNYTVSGSPAGSDTKNLSDGEDRIIIDDPHGDIGGTFNGSGTVATAFFSGFQLADRLDISDSDIVVQDGVSSSTLSQGNYNSTITHEMGHTLGFRHSNQNKYSQNGTSCSAPLPCSSGAIMNSSIVGGLNGNLQSWDSAAVNNNYGSSPDPDYQIISEGPEKPWYRGSPSVSWRITSQEEPCTGPTITQQPSATPSSITSGQSSTLSVAATAGEGSPSYQWYTGNTSGSGSMISGATSSSVVVSPTANATYWVRVTDGCSSVDSNTVTVTVTACGPSITQQPSATPSSINEGESSTLSVSASTSDGGLSYQWYVGNSGQTGNPVSGGTSASIQVSPATTTTYWVQVTDACASANSNAVTVTVIACDPVITQQPFDRTITAGQTATLSINVSNATQVLWYRGVRGDTSNLIGSGTSEQVAPMSTTEYWARVSNSCSSVDSRTVTVTVEACQEPQITTQPASTSVESGKSAVLSVGVSGSAPITLTWYEGSPPDRSKVVGSGSFVSVTPASNKSYWVQAVNSCGTANSVAATVTVTGGCEAPQITQHPQQTTIKAGETATLAVSVTGTTLAYQWYEVRGGGTEFVPIQGANAPTYTTPQLAATTAYLVQITNTCGVANSNQVQVIVSQCTPPAITAQPQSVAVPGGTRVVLSVTATGTGPLSYQWFEGESGMPSIPVAGATSSTLVIARATASSYWVQVSNECGEDDSATAVVSVEVSRRRSVRRP